MSIVVHKSMVPHYHKIMRGEYDIPGLELPENATVLDIGACCGEFTEWALNRWPTCNVIAYEPNPEALAFLKKNFGQNDRVTIINKAVWPTGDDVKMCQGMNNTGEAAFVSLAGSEQDTERHFFAGVVNELPPADFVKIDAEGAEEGILGLVDMDQAKGIALEWHGAHNFYMCLGFLGGDKETVLAEHVPERGILTWTPNQGPVIRGPLLPLPLVQNDGAPLPITSKLYIAIPVHYQPIAAFQMSCMNLQQHTPGAHWEFLVGDAHPDRARHRLVKMFLDSDKEYLLFLDADLKFEAKQILSLLDRQKDMIVGFYAKKSIGPAQWVGNADNPNPDAEGLVTMKEAATGCMLIHRRVIEAIIAKHPELTYQADPDGVNTEWAVFQSGVFEDKDINPPRRRWLSEDWAFSWRARECGFTIYGDPGVVCLHQGVCMFPTEPSKEVKEDAK